MSSASEIDGSLPYRESSQEQQPGDQPTQDDGPTQTVDQHSEPDQVTGSPQDTETPDSIASDNMPSLTTGSSAAASSNSPGSAHHLSGSTQVDDSSEDYIVPPEDNREQRIELPRELWRALDAHMEATTETVRVVDRTIEDLKNARNAVGDAASDVRDVLVSLRLGERGEEVDAGIDPDVED